MTTTDLTTVLAQLEGLRWYTIPEDQGQIFEVSYAYDKEGGAYMRTHDQSDGEVRLYHGLLDWDLEEEGDDWDLAPQVLSWVDVIERAQVEAAIGTFLHAPAEAGRDDGSYVFGVYDPGGDSEEAEETRLLIAEHLPRGWTAEWTGDANGDESDLSVSRN